MATTPLSNFIPPPTAANEDAGMLPAADDDALYSSCAMLAAEQEVRDMIEGCEALNVLIGAAERALDGAADCPVTASALRWTVGRLQRQLSELLLDLKPCAASRLLWIAPQRVN